MNEDVPSGMVRSSASTSCTLLLPVEPFRAICFNALPAHLAISSYHSSPKSLHSIGWIHRDLKPANLGVVNLDPPHAVILDLGQAIHVDPSLIGRDDSNGFIPQTPGRVGTRSYLAPEMEKSSYSETVDIWALGIVAHEVFLGYYPFKRSTSANLWLPTTNPQYIETREEFKRRINALGEAKNDPIEPLIQKMFWWSPETRVQAKDALRHPSLQGAITEIPKNYPQPAQKRPRGVSD